VVAMIKELLDTRIRCCALEYAHFHPHLPHCRPCQKLARGPHRLCCRPSVQEDGGDIVFHVSKTCGPWRRSPAPPLMASWVAAVVVICSLLKMGL
jgi:hypothetical protein